MNVSDELKQKILERSDTLDMAIYAVLASLPTRIAVPALITSFVNMITTVHDTPGKMKGFRDMFNELMNKLIAKAETENLSKSE